jgi:thioredoxin 1
MPTEITAPLHFRTLLTGNTYLVADFYATWCPPCKTIAPIYEQLSKAHSAPGRIAFVKVNVDEQREVAAQYGITAMPTFMVFKGGKKIEDIKGANPPALKKAVEGIASAVKAEAGKTEVKTAESAEKVKGTEATKEEGKPVSGSYGMTGGNNWKMSLT